MDTEREQRSLKTSEAEARESGLPGGGQGRTDIPGHTGVYPISASEGAGGEAPVRTEPAWGQGERGAAGYEDSGDSGIMNFGEAQAPEQLPDVRAPEALPVVRPEAEKR